MSWFTPKLEPGERVLLRNTALRNPMLFFITGAAGVGVLLPFFGRHPDAPDIAALRVLLGVVVPLGLYWAVAVFLSRATMAGWAITDRRVLAWRGVTRREVAELRRDEIDETALNADDLMVRGAGRRPRLNLKRIRDDALQAALGNIAPPKGLKTPPLNRILEQGETVIWRHTAFGKWRFPAAPWSAAVTDRRVLLRRLHDRTRHDAIPLAAIEEIEAPHETSHRVYLHANGQRHEFRPGDLPAAERMHKAIQGVLP